jgi:hypothetical protein
MGIVFILFKEPHPYRSYRFPGWRPDLHLHRIQWQ